MKRALLILAVAIVAAGIVFSSPVGSTTYRDRYLTFRHPVSWRPYHWAIPADGVHYVVWLSNARLRDPCTIRTRTEYRCGYPIGRLPRGGVLVTWTASSLPGVESKSSSRLSIVRPGACKDIGADVTMVKLVREGRNLFDLSACLRGPELARAERQVRAMVASAHFSGR